MRSDPLFGGEKSSGKRSLIMNEYRRSIFSARSSLRSRVILLIHSMKLDQGLVILTDSSGDFIRQSSL
jgi:hypothetical protein